MRHVGGQVGKHVGPDYRLLEGNVNLAQIVHISTGTTEHVGKAPFRFRYGTQMERRCELVVIGTPDGRQDQGGAEVKNRHGVNYELVMRTAGEKTRPSARERPTHCGTLGYKEESSAPLRSIG